mmetsp:Transcript_24846/g.63984  ORF Transcript_24846/g.63984 Transcript_24846/m.63984 type:complete len:471 (-) Transcript_24846:534-1946(-)
MHSNLEIWGAAAWAEERGSGPSQLFWSWALGWMCTPAGSGLDIRDLGRLPLRLGAEGYALLALDKHLDNVAVVAGEDELGEVLLDGAVLGHVQDVHIHLAIQWRSDVSERINQDGIELVANLKATDFACQLERRCAADGGHVERVLVVDRLPGRVATVLKVQRFGPHDRGLHDLSHADRVAAADVSAEPQQLVPLGLVPGHRRDAAAELVVGAGAVAARGATVHHHLELAGVEVHAVRDDGAVGQQPRVHVHLGVGLPKPRLHGCHLVQVLTHVRLDQQVPLRRKLAKPVQHRLAACQRKARGDHRRHQPLFHALQLIHLIQEAQRLVVAALQSLVHMERAAAAIVVIHVDLSDKAALPVVTAQLREAHRGICVGGGVNHGAGDAHAEVVLDGARVRDVHERAVRGPVHLSGVDKVVLQSVGVLFQPGEKWEVGPQAAVPQLGVMHVGVHKAGKPEAEAVHVAAQLLHAR